MVFKKGNDYWKTNGFQVGHKCYTHLKGKHRSQETKDKISKALKGIPLSEERKKNMKNLFVKGHKLNIGRYKSEETIKKFIESRKGYRHLEETKLNIGKGNFGRKRTEETKQKLSAITKLQFINGMPEETKKKIRNHRHTKETKTKMSKNSARYWKGKKRPDQKQIWKEIRKNQIFPVKDTTIEVKIQKFLEQLGIDYFKHKYMNIEHGYQCDILIPSINMVIECDGNYWHKYPIGTEIDSIRTRELLEKGFKVLRLWEFEIKEMSVEEFKERLKNE